MYIAITTIVTNKATYASSPPAESVVYKQAKEASVNISMLIYFFCSSWKRFHSEIASKTNGKTHIPEITIDEVHTLYDIFDSGQGTNKWSLCKKAVRRFSTDTIIDA